VLIDFGFDPSTSVSNMGIKAPQKFTDSDLAAQLKETCLFILAQMEMALVAVAAENNRARPRFWLKKAPLVFTP
jgi:hypothetical protein